MSPRHFVIPTYVALCMMLGGASVEGWIGNTIVQILGAGIIGWAIGWPVKASYSVPARRLLLLLVLILGVALLQLVPLPPAIWTRLPGRELVTDSFAAMAVPLPWLPLSLAADRSMAALAWAIPGFAIVLGIIRLRAFNAAALFIAIAIMIVANVFLGALQISTGEAGGWYPYRITNFIRASGFFSNSNHMADLLVLGFPVAAALVARSLQRRGRHRLAPAVWAASIGFALVSIVGLAINQSLAGFGLALPSAAASAMILLLRGKSMKRAHLGICAALGLAAVAIVMSGPMGNNLTSEQASDDDQSRQTIWTDTLAASVKYVPFGSGSGTFIDLYPLETRAAETDRVYVNHAHNDYLELWLETGIFGLAAVALFLTWWLLRSWRIWRDAESDPFERGATVISAVLLIHSLVDYPLRTAALLAVFAAACGLIARPREQKAVRAATRTGGRHVTA